MKIYAALFWILVGAFGIKAIEEVVATRVAFGYNKINDARHSYCKNRSRKIYRKLTFQVSRTYDRCMRDEI